MQLIYILSAFVIVIPTFAEKNEDNPIVGVIKVLQDLDKKILSDQEMEDAGYREFFKWCNEVTAEETHNIKMSERTLDKINAAIDKYFAEIEAAGEVISEEAEAIAKNVHDAAVAKELREKQAAEFKIAEKELADSIDMLSRAMNVLQGETQKGAAAYLQAVNKKMPELLQVFNAITDAAAFSTTDQAKLAAMVQAQQNAEDELVAPSADNYSTRSADILELLENMKDKADSELSELRRGETQARFVYTQLTNSLRAQKDANEKDMEEAKKDKSEASEEKAEAEKDEKETRGVFEVENKKYKATSAQCMKTSSDYEQARKSRKEELHVLNEAIDILKSKTSGATERTYSLIQQLSSQHSSLHSATGLAGREVLKLVKRMAKMHHSAALAQLASRINAVVRYGSDSGEDIFDKVKALIKDLVAKLEREADAAATEKAYCDDQMGDTQKKKEELDAGLQSYEAAIDKYAARSAGTKEDVKELQRQLSRLAKENVELEKLRKEEHETFLVSKKDLQEGLQGVRQALDLLKEYFATNDDSADGGASGTPPPTDVAYLQKMNQPQVPELGHKKSQGAAEGIIEILEMTESDFATSLAKLETQESDAQAQFETASQVEEIEKAAKEQEIKFKVREYKSLDKMITQLSADRDAASTEQAAVLEFYAHVKDRCVAEPESFEERKKRRNAEITGLKEALEILRNEAAFMQRSRPRRLRRPAQISPDS